MTNHVSDLVHWIDTEVEDRDSTLLESWVSSINLDKFAVDLAKSFLNSSTSFDQANGLLNQMMPIASFEEAPKIFWQFYIAFEDYEHLDNPKNEATLRIEKELRELNEI